MSDGNSTRDSMMPQSAVSAIHQTVSCTATSFNAFLGTAAHKHACLHAYVGKHAPKAKEGLSNKQRHQAISTQLKLAIQCSRACQPTIQAQVIGLSLSVLAAHATVELQHRNLACQECNMSAQGTNL